MAELKVARKAVLSADEMAYLVDMQVEWMVELKVEWKAVSLDGRLDG